MRRGSRLTFIVPFLLGTIFGAVAGTTLGALIGHRFAAVIQPIASIFGRGHDDELRFDLLLQ